MEIPTSLEMATVVVNCKLVALRSSATSLTGTYKNRLGKWSNSPSPTNLPFSEFKTPIFLSWDPDNSSRLLRRIMRVILSICAFFSLLVVQTHAAAAASSVEPEHSSHSHHPHSAWSGSWSHSHTGTGHHSHTGSMSFHHGHRTDSASPAATPAASG